MAAGSRTSKKKGSGSKIKKYKRSRDTKRRGKDYDEICDGVAKRDAGTAAPIPFDDDLPGGGQFYCVETGKHFCDQRSLDDHKKSRAYKRRVKELKEISAFTQHDAEAAAGMTREELPKMRDVRARQAAEAAESRMETS